MSIPADFPYIDDLSIITQKSEIRASTTASTSPADYYIYNYYYFPFLVWAVLAAVFFFMARYFIAAFIARWRNAERSKR